MVDICQTRRSAVAMVELIFAIVVMGIAMLSAPQLISVSAKSTSVALQQEGINETATRINMILTYDWDQNNVKYCYGTPSILRTVSGDTELNASNTGNRRVGVSTNTAPPTTHTFNCAGTQYNATAIGQEATGVFDDIDDFNGSSFLNTVTGLGTGDTSVGVDYIEQETVKIVTTVQYASDTATYSNEIIQDFNPFVASAGGSTNIKMISTTLTSTDSAQELQKNITLRAFSCNLGSYQYYRRTMP